MTDGCKRAIFAAFFANLGIAASKLVGFVITRSAGMLAEAIHSFADTGNQALLLVGGSKARRRATPEHPFGYGRERYFWAFAVALVLFSMGGLFALYEGIEKLRHPHELESPAVAIVILLLAVGLEGFSLRTAVHEANHVKPSDMGWFTFIHRSKQPELRVVLLEDTGALMGLMAALGGVLLAHFTDNPRWDAAGSVAIGVLLIAIAVVLIIEMKGLLIGESASEGDQQLIMAAMTSGPHVRSLIHIRTEHLGPDEILVAAKLEFDRDLDLLRLADAIDATEVRVRDAVPAARLIYIEPDVRRTPADV